MASAKDARSLFESFKELVVNLDNSHLPSLRQIVKMSTDLINNLSHPPPAQQNITVDMDKLFKHIPNIFANHLEISTNLPLQDGETTAPDFSDPAIFMDSLTKELESLNLESKYAPNHHKVATQWLLDNTNPHKESRSLNLHLI